MADHLQVEQILRAVICSPLFNGRGEKFTRTLRVTSEIADISVTSRTVRVHPEWAVELGPVEAARTIVERCEAFDQRVEAGRALYAGTLFHGLMNAVDACRAAGREDLVSAALEASRSVPRSRSLTIPQPRFIPWTFESTITYTAEELQQAIERCES